MGNTQKPDVVQAKINNAAAADLVNVISDLHAGNIAEGSAIAKAIVSAIVQGKISNVRIVY